MPAGRRGEQRIDRLGVADHVGEVADRCTVGIPRSVDVVGEHRLGSERGVVETPAVPDGRFEQRLARRVAFATLSRPDRLRVLAPFAGAAARLGARRPGGAPSNPSRIGTPEATSCS